VQRARHRVLTIAEVDAEIAQADAPSQSAQPAGVGCRAPGVVEAEELKARAPSERVLEVQERERRAGALLEVIAVHRADAADAEAALRRQRAPGPAADRADAEVLMRRQRGAIARAHDVAVEIEVAAERIAGSDLRRPVDAPDRRRIVARRRRI